VNSSFISSLEVLSSSLFEGFLSSLSTDCAVSPAATPSVSSTLSDCSLLATPLSSGALSSCPILDFSAVLADPSFSAPSASSTLSPPFCSAPPLAGIFFSLKARIRPFG